MARSEQGELTFDPGEAAWFIVSVRRVIQEDLIIQGIEPTEEKILEGVRRAKHSLKDWTSLMEKAALLRSVEAKPLVERLREEGIGEDAALTRAYRVISERYREGFVDDGFNGIETSDFWWKFSSGEDC